MDKLPSLWQSQPKAHVSVIAEIKGRMTSTWTFEMIYREVVKSGIQDDDDKLMTTRALVIIRDHRASYRKELAIVS